MARWRLINAHYLNVPGTEWEYKEIDQTTGRQGRKVFTVPLYMDPRDPADHNYPGQIIVTNAASKEWPRDIIFLGDPTPDMEPLDEEAEAITAKLREVWEHPIESLPSTMSEGESAFMAKMMEAFGQRPNVSANQVSVEEFNEMKRLVEDLKAQIATGKPTSPLAVKPALTKGV